jgi:hypothetical protein
MEQLHSCRGNMPNLLHFIFYFFFFCGGFFYVRNYFNVLDRVCVAYLFTVERGVVIS